MLIDAAEHFLSGPSDHKDFKETVRTKLVCGLKTGYNTAFNFDKLVTSTHTLATVLEGCAFY